MKMFTEEEEQAVMSAIATAFGGNGNDYVLDYKEENSLCGTLCLLPVEVKSNDFYADMPVLVIYNEITREYGVFVPEDWQCPYVPQNMHEAEGCAWVQIADYLPDF